MKHKIIIIILIVFSFVVADCLLASMSSTNYQIWADVFSVGGGEDLSSDNYQLDYTLGGGVIGRSLSDNNSARAGFREAMKDNATPILTLSVSSSSLELGELDTATVKSASHTLTVESNSSSGVSVTFAGGTLSDGSGHNISALGSTATASTPGESQFGFNVIYSSGDATALSQAPYSTAGSYAHNSGDEIISSAGAMSSSAVFTATYIANISGNEPAGTYTASITYTATSNF